MNGEPAEITFTENGPTDIARLDTLHRLIDWDKHSRRPEEETAEMGVLAHLERSRYPSVTLMGGSGIPDFYQRFGFQFVASDTPARVWRRGI